MLAGARSARSRPRAMGARSHDPRARNDDPGARASPFDAERDGFVMGEAPSRFVLESWTGAVAPVRIYGEIAGYGRNSDATTSLPSPGGEGAAARM